MIQVSFYRNKRNENKYLEVHNDGHHHNAVRQFILCRNGVKNMTGDGFLHRWRKNNLLDLLEDYEKIDTLSI